MNRQVVELSGNWTLELGAERAAAPEALSLEGVPATVPGCVHTDLLAQGLIPDPYLDRNELLVEWIGRCDWVYRTQVQVDAALLAHERVELACDGLDTLATVRVNGHVVGTADNMHRRWRFDLRQVLQPGQNELSITFAAPMLHIERLKSQMPDRPHVGAGSNPQHPFHLIRKMACNFGWDWGPVLPTSGIWRAIRIEAWSQARLMDICPAVRRADAELAEVDIRVDLDHASLSESCRLVMALTGPDGNLVDRVEMPAEQPQAAATLQVPQPRRWWPAGHGDQPLYQLTVRLIDKSGQMLDEASRRLGLRTAELCMDADDKPVDGRGLGQTFHFKINGRRVFCKGANWIPDDCFPSRITPQRYRRRVRQAADANMNMMRVWGGGIYEGQAFYDACDELGIMVWQDFCCACACYPEEEPFWSSFEAEARDNIARLSAHPSLVLWCGNNECIQGTFHWGPKWKAIREEGKITWGLGYYLGLFPQLMAELDPTRPYWPGSPYSGTMQIEPNNQLRGDNHLWDVWNGQGDYHNYLAHTPRFASEYGFHGPPCWPTLARAIPEDQREWTSPAMILHNKHAGGQQTATARIADRFDISPDTPFKDVVFLAGINQARALTVGCEWFRALSPWCSGALYWQHNDCWPVSSWSAIDSEGRPKLLWFATRRFFRPRLMTILPRQRVPQGQPFGPLDVYFHNDSADSWSGQVRVRRLTVAGSVLEESAWAFHADAQATARVSLPDHWSGDPGEFLLAETDSDRAWFFFGQDRHIPYPPLAWTARLERLGREHRLTVTAQSLLRELCILADHVDEDAQVDDQLIHLLPGESHTFVIHASRELSESELTRPDVLRCSNQLVTQPALAT